MVCITHPLGGDSAKHQGGGVRRKLPLKASMGAGVEGAEREYRRGERERKVTSTLALNCTYIHAHTNKHTHTHTHHTRTHKKYEIIDAPLLSEPHL